MKYVFEKGISMPLCAVKDNIYFDYLTGQAITNKNALDFIKRGLKNKSMKLQDYDLKIYRIADTENDTTIAYNYEINGVSNYLETNKVPFNSQVRQFIIDKLLTGEYKQELIWGWILWK